MDLEQMTKMLIEGDVLAKHDGEMGRHWYEGRTWSGWLNKGEYIIEWGGRLYRVETPREL